MQTNESSIKKSSSNIGAWVFWGLSIAYCISPIDIIPDVPVIGWVDDFFITLTGTLNLIQKTCKESMLWLSQIAAILKWITIALGIIIILLILLLGVSIYSLF